jgi:hypothetical protein
MPFAPRFLEAGESKIIDSLFTVTHRDMKAALDYFYWTAPDRLIEDLPAFALTILGDFDVFQFPLLVIDPDRLSSEETNDGFYLSQSLRVGAGMAIKDASINGATKKAIKYVRAWKAVLRTATTADLFGDAIANTFEHVVDIDHQYQKRRSLGTEYVQPVVFDLKFKFGEK